MVKMQIYILLLQCFVFLSDEMVFCKFNSLTFKYLWNIMQIGPATGANDSRLQDLTVEKGTIHTKRHSGEDPIKTG